MAARVVLLAGPSGSGKSFIAHRTGLPVLPLDDFYLDGDDPRAPRVDGRVDWESPASWDAAAAVDAIERLARTGSVLLPRYDLSVDRRTGSEPLALVGAPLFVAEGIFAAEIVTACRDRDVLAAAFALRRPRPVTFVRRLVRDLAEHRKPPLTLFRRGCVLYRTEPRVLVRQVELGCQPASARLLLGRVRALGALPAPAGGTALAGWHGDPGLV